MSKYLATIGPSAEPVAYGAFATALLELAVVFLPRFGVSLSQPEQIALGGLVLATITILTRAQVQPTPANPTANPTVQPPAATPPAA